MFSFKAIFICFIVTAQATNVSYDGRAITIDGQRRVILSGSIHYPRSTSEMWPDLIKKAKEGGLNAIETYVFWNAHEPLRRQYDFTGNLDLVKFIKAIQAEGLYSVLRIGPYVCAEWNYGGFPVWLHNMPGIELRTLNDVFMNEMQNFTTLIVDMMKQEKLFASQGGPIILSQIENEYGNVMAIYEDAGKAYIDWCANMAQSLDIGVPWIMCQQKDAPQPMINTCNGWYCDDFTPSNPNTPKLWTENWTGWFKSWGGLDPKRTAEDIAFAVARFFQTGGTFQNYYMYHGGTNFGRTAGGPYITTTYDYDAPLDEFGNLNQPKYGHLTELHKVLKSMEKTLTHGSITQVDDGNSVSITAYVDGETSACFLSNANETTNATVSWKGNTYNVPAWSVSILPDCQTEVYNTAKVNTQTSVMVKKVEEKESIPLKWTWKPENIQDTVVLGKGEISASQLLEQKVTNDISDYFWYMTSLNINKDDPVFGDNMTIRINGTGNVIHAFVNGNHIGNDQWFYILPPSHDGLTKSKFELLLDINSFQDGGSSQWAKYDILNDNFEKSVKLNPGLNQISLLSATVGLKNYGPKFDMIEAGIPGPVEIVGVKDDETVIKDLSAHKWTYKVGLNGVANKLNLTDSTQWRSDELPLNRMMTWYKTTFKAPCGKDAVALDLKGLGKGYAWVNGNNIGRYWPSFIAEEDGCSSDACDYRGSYDNNKCVFNCGKPTQRWYHVPRSFMNEEENELVLFEEFGGDPTFVNFQTVRVGKVCGSAYENKTMEITCQGRPITSIRFAIFGDVKGECGSFVTSCEGENDAISIVEKACLGKETCSVRADETTFGLTKCEENATKKLIVEAVC